jgi:glycine cleavage system H protein
MDNKQYHFPVELYYSERGHLWLKHLGNTVALGLNAVAQETFGEIVYISILDIGTTIESGQVMGSIEAAKMVDDLIAPISGTITAVNEDVLRNPTIIDDDPYGKGWFIQIDPSAWEEESPKLIHDSRLDAWIKIQMELLEDE